jgi:S-adenosylmethionine synthetase
LALALEQHLNQSGNGPRDLRFGQDIKVMAARQGRHVDVTINVAVHPLAATDADAYEAILADLHAQLDQLAALTLGGALPYRLRLNSGDSNPFRGKRHYLLGTGSCLEFGEEGMVGRGNTPAGLIPVHRPKSVEAAYGKNPTYHAGKVYTLYADQLARAVHAQTGAGATITIVARHSDPLRRPALIDVALHGQADHEIVQDLACATLEGTDHVGLALDGALVPR